MTPSRTESIGSRSVAMAVRRLSRHVPFFKARAPRVVAVVIGGVLFVTAVGKALDPTAPYPMIESVLNANLFQRRALLNRRRGGAGRGAARRAALVGCVAACGLLGARGAHGGIHGDHHDACAGSERSAVWLLRRAEAAGCGCAGCEPVGARAQRGPARRLRLDLRRGDAAAGRG